MKENEKVKAILSHKLLEEPNAEPLRWPILWNESLLESLKVQSGSEALDVRFFIIYYHYYYYIIYFK